MNDEKNPNPTSANGVVVYRPPVRDLRREAETSRSYIVGIRKDANPPLRIYALVSEFTEDELERLRKTPLGNPLRATAKSYWHEKQRIVLLYRPGDRNDWVAIYPHALATIQCVAVDVNDPYCRDYRVYAGSLPAQLQILGQAGLEDYYIDVNAVVTARVLI